MAEVQKPVHFNKGFTLVEILIVVAILGILSAIVMPQFQGHIQKSKESAAKENLQMIRTAIERYAVKHNDIPPGYPLNDISRTPNYIQYGKQLVFDGHYLSELPENPLNNKINVRVIPNGQDFPSAPTGGYGWIYKPQTKEIRLDYQGNDSEGIPYFEY